MRGPSRSCLPRRHRKRLAGWPLRESGHTVVSVNAAAVSLASARRNIRFKLLQLKLHLIEQMGLALATLTVETHRAFLQVTRRLSKRAEPV